MKTLTNLLIIALSASFMFTSCKKDDPKPEVPIIEEEQNQDPPSSNLSPTENKANLEQAGIDFVNALDDLMESDAITAAESLGNITNTAKSGTVKLALVDAIANIDNGGYGDEMKSFLQTGSIREDITDVAGIYTWNPDLQDFEETYTDLLMVKFIYPYEGSSTNDCELTFSCELVDINDQYLETPEAPSNITATLVAKGNEVVEYEFTATYNSDGIPSSVSSSLTIDNMYTWAHTASQSTTAISYNFSFTKSSTILMNSGFDVTGNFVTEEIDDYVTRLDSMDVYEKGVITEAGSYVQNVSMHYQIMNIKLVQSANATRLAAGLDNLAEQEENETISEDEFDQQMVSLLNSNVDLYLMYVQENKKLADAELYIKVVEEEYYDSWTDQMVTEEHNEVAVRFMFGPDSSPVDAEVYFQEGFDDLETEMTNMMDRMEALLAAYEIDTTQEEEPIYY